MALFNPYQQTNYQFPYQPQPVNTNNAINWVQGIEGAKAFQMPTNANAIMLDSENEGIFYIKTSDGVGMCNLRTFKFEEITNQQSQKPNLDEYVKKSELESLIKSMLGGSEDDKPVQTTKRSKLITE